MDNMNRILNNKWRAAGCAAAEKNACVYTRSLSGKRVLHEDRKSGFTLVELLAAMTTLAVIILMMGRIYQDSIRAMTAGQRTADIAAEVRAVMDFIARETEMMVFDHPDNPPYLMAGYRSQIEAAAGTGGRSSDLLFGNYFADEISFPAFVSSPYDDTDYREVAQITYRVTQMNDLAGDPLKYQYGLKRRIFKNMAANGWDCYTDASVTKDRRWSYPGRRSGLDSDSRGIPVELLDNIWNVYWGWWNRKYEDADPDERTVTSVDTYFGGVDTPPAITPANPPYYIDFYVELFDQKAAERAALLYDAQGMSTNVLNFLEKNVRRFRHRLFYPNAHGYYFNGSMM